MGSNSSRGWKKRDDQRLATTGKRKRKNRKSQPFQITSRSQLPKDFRTWTEGQWSAAERLQREKEEEKLPTCPNCSTKPSEDNGYEEKFCECGMTHCVTKRPDGLENENEAAKKFKRSK